MKRLKRGSIVVQRHRWSVCVQNIFAYRESEGDAHGVDQDAVERRMEVALVVAREDILRCFLTYAGQDDGGEQCVQY